MKRVVNILLLGLLGVLVLIAAALIISSVTERRDREQKEKELREQQLNRYGEDLMALCQSVQPEVTGEFPLTTAPLRPLVLETGSSHAHQVHESLSADRYPQSRAEVDLVLCLDKAGVGEKVETGRCSYKDTERVAVLYRVDPEVIAIDPGREPGNCPFSIEKSGPDQEVLGDSPSSATILAWVDLQQAQAQTRTWGEDILSLCETPAEPDFSLTALEETPKLLILETGTRNVHPWYRDLQPDWKAQSAEELDLVVCAPQLDEDSTEAVKILDCQFFVTSGGNMEGTQAVPVYQRFAEALLTDPKTGTVVARLNVEGRARAYQTLSAEPGCPTSIGADEFDGIYGDYPTAAQLQGAIRDTLLAGD
jgi:hypothetical protein